MWPVVQVPGGTAAPPPARRLFFCPWIAHCSLLHTVFQDQQAGLAGSTAQGIERQASPSNLCDTEASVCHCQVTQTTHRLRQMARHLRAKSPPAGSLFGVKQAANHNNFFTMGHLLPLHL